MNDTYIEMVGMLAGFLMSVSFIPQSLKTIRTKDTKSLSLVTYITYVASCVAWFSYGVLLESFPMMFWNSVTFAFAATILTLKIRYG